MIFIKNCEKKRCTMFSGIVFACMGILFFCQNDILISMERTFEMTDDQTKVYNQIVQSFTGQEGAKKLSIRYDDWVKQPELKNIIKLGADGKPDSELFFNALREFFKKNGPEIKILEIRACSLGEIDISDLKNLTQLTLFNTNLNKIIGLGEAKDLTSLDLSQNQLQEIVGLPHLTKLQFLRCCVNKLQNKISVETLRELEVLDLGKNQLTHVEGLGSLSNLKWLSLSNNKLEYVESLEGLKNLKELDLSFNSLKELNFGVGTIKRQGFTVTLELEGPINLTKLILGSNNFTLKSIAWLKFFKDLISLDLSNNKLDGEIDVSDLDKLMFLDLSSNKLTGIKGLRKLINLESGIFHNNKLVKIEKLSKLTKLSSLDLHGNELSEIEGLKKLVGLDSLNLSNNKFKLLKFKGKKPRKMLLTKLILGSNELNLKNIAWLNDLEFLQFLDLSNNGFEGNFIIPKLEELKILDLHGNKLTKVESLSKLVNLEELNLSNNQLKEIGQYSIKGFLTGKRNLNYLKNLKKLNLAENAELDGILDVTALVKLDSLDLGGTELAQIGFEEQDPLKIKIISMSEALRNLADRLKLLAKKMADVKKSIDH